ncbi:MAG: SPOR domain-containing protein [bacterium]|nr:SPOR domain-containing protein [bacterium]MDT8394889.1 SPOR domain-containing protein [bacterium]
MGDDFDLFPKRENLDPFSFGTREKKSEAELKEKGTEDLFGQEDQPPAPPPLPDLPLDLPGAEPAAVGEGLPSLEPTIPEPPPLPPPPPPPSGPVASPSDFSSDGPISEEKTFDEPVFDDSKPTPAPGKKSGRKTPSPFVFVGGALLIIIGLLFGAYTYLMKGRAPEPRAALPPVSVSVPVPSPAPVPASGPETQTEPAKPSPPESAVKSGTPPSPTPAPAPVPEPAKPEPPESEPVKPEPGTPPEPARTAAAQPSPPRVPQPGAAAVSPGDVQYSIQVGAFILQSSVLELENKLRSLGHEPFRKEGSTTVMMNMLTVGPFASVAEARSALFRLKAADVDSNVRRRADGGAIVNAGSYLLEENADSVMKKIRSLGYPVRMSKNEARLPMTFVRVGRYPDMEEASVLKDELRGKGFDAIVVKLQ